MTKRIRVKSHYISLQTIGTSNFIPVHFVEPTECYYIQQVYPVLHSHYLFSLYFLK